MARPKKCRKVCCLPESTSFGPLVSALGESEWEPDVRLHVDEYETIRLIDFEGLTQEQCADKMHIARTTVQGIYAEARKKIADAIVNGKRIIIEGGDYHLCSGKGGHCGKNCQRKKQEILANLTKERNTMLIAIPVESEDMNGVVCPSFGRAPFFLLYDTSDDTSRFVENGAADAQGGAGIKAAQIVADLKVNAILTPRCGQNAADVLQPAGVSFYKTTEASVAEQIRLFKEKALAPLTEFHAGFHGRGK